MSDANPLSIKNALYSAAIGGGGTEYAANEYQFFLRLLAAGLTIDSSGNLTVTNLTNLSNLNASNLTTGTVPLARLSGITTTQLSGTAGITSAQLAGAIPFSQLALNAGDVPWADVSKSGSSLADLATRSASALNSGNLANAQLPSGSVAWTLTDLTLTGASLTIGTTLTVTGHATLEGVTSTGATGTGRFVFDGSPTIQTLLTISGAANLSGLAVVATTTNKPALLFSNATTGSLANIRANNSKGLEFVVNGGSTTGFTLDVSGNGVLTGTLDLSGAAAGQIFFPATQNPSSGANVLDDYEEGSWTPSDQSGATLVFTAVTGRYIKIGRLVIAFCTLTFPSTANGATAVIGGLPYTVDSPGDNIYGGFTMFDSGAITLSAQALAASTTFNVVSGSGNAVNSTLSLNRIRFSIVYLASA